MTTLARPLERKVTHTHTSGEGVVLVITDVPALVYEDSNGIRQVKYKGASSRVITNYIKQALELFSGSTVYSTSFEEASFGISVDAQIRFAGPKIKHDELSIKNWHEATNRLYKSYEKIGGAVKQTRGSKRILYPTVKTVTRGSLIFGLKSESPTVTQQTLFDDRLAVEEATPEEVQILQLLIDGHALVMGKRAERENPLLSHPQIRFATIKAVELLSPSDKSDIEEVQIIPRSDVVARSEVVAFTPSTHQKAKHQRIELEANPIDEGRDRRDVLIVGQIKMLDRAGRMTIDNIEPNHPEGPKYPATSIFVDSIFVKLTDFFKNRKRVLFRGIEFRTNERWTSEPWIMEVEEAPSQEEVNRLALSLT